MISATETPKAAARLLAANAIAKGFKPEALHEYRDVTGTPIYWRIRARRDNGDKWMRPMMVNGHGYELREPDFPDKKPLYMLDRIAADPSSRIWIVEGEKAADVLTKLGALTTTSGGASSAGDADWSQLAGRDCVIWPDNDDPGKAYAGEVGNMLAGMGCALACVDVDKLGLPPKGDAVEWLETRQNATLSDLATLPLLAYQPLAQNATAADLVNTDERPRFMPVTMFDLVSREFPPREMLLGPWLHEQCLAQVHAWRGIGKTHFALGVTYAVGTGGTFLRWEARQAQRVLFIDGEMPAVALQERLRAMIEADERDIDCDGALLRFITPDCLDGPPPDLASADDQLLLQRVIDEFDPKLIIVDNISTLVRSGGSENDAEAWIPVQAWALQMRRQGRAVLFVHHTGKGGKQRGTSKREDVLDAVIALGRPEPYDPADGARFIVEFEKARHVRGDDAKSFEAHLTHDARGRQTWTMRDIEASTMERVVRLWADGITSVRELAEELGVHKSNVSRALKRARADGLIVDKGTA